MSSVIVWSTSTPVEVPTSSWNRPADDNRVVGKCTACGCVEVLLNEAHGFADLTAIGESGKYPIGYGCEVCD